ncbi:MAG: hypothetical protein LBG97_08500 [Coriobacteriales bacterium]|jgi:hypothetical protein|nr:hypothetical protein [Coriobacteriales bacterium]
MKLYLDNCCFNRPFDDQSIVRNRLETEAKMYVQSQIQKGYYELIWSYILEYENGESPHPDRQASTLKWKDDAERFITSIIREPFDYTEWQHKLF